MSKPYRKADNPLEGAALMKLTFSARGELDDPNFRAIYRGVLNDLGLSDKDVKKYIRDHKAELIDRLGDVDPATFNTD